MTLTRKLQITLLGGVSALFCGVGACVWIDQTVREREAARGRARQAVDDIERELSRLADRNILSLARMAASAAGSAKSATDEKLAALRDTFGLSEVHAIDTNGIVVATSEPADKFYDMASTEQSAEFLRLLKPTENEYAQQLRPKTNTGTAMRYGAVSFQDGGFLQVAFDEKAFRRDMLTHVYGLTASVSVGPGGFMLMASPGGSVMSAPHRMRYLIDAPLAPYAGRPLPKRAPDGSKPEPELFQFVQSGERMLGWLDLADAFPVMVVQPEKEVFANRNAMISTIVRAEVPLYLLFFVAFHLLLRRFVTRDVRKIDDTLVRISSGDLALEVDARSCDEFKSISASINAAAATLRRHAREERDRLESERDAAIASEKARNYFFATVSHDIRTPLNAIIGFSQLLKLGVADEKERARCLDGIVASGGVLMQLINDVLDLSKLEAGKMVFKPVWCEPAAIAAETLSAFSHAADERGLELGVDAPPDLPRILADPHRLRQILFNFVGNAMKFTERGSVRVRIRRTGASDLEIAVADTGCGIPKDELERLGSPFVQLDKKTGRGTGLGLAICRQLLSRMGGTLRIESELGRGSVFAAVLDDVRFEGEGGGPVAPERGPAAPAPAPSPAPAPDGDGTDSGLRRSSIGDWAAVKVLLVDDVKVNLLVLSSLCRKLGLARLETAGSAAEALEKLRVWAADPAERAGLVLTDLWMPETDGVALATAIRADPALHGTLVCAVTADVDIRKSGTAASFDGVLLKPILLDNLSAFFESLPR